MKITKCDTYLCGNPWKNWLFTRLETDEGIHGVGEGTLNGFGKTVEAAVHELEPFYIGMDPFQIETITQRMWRDVYSEGGQIHGCAVSAVEIACWDIIGKALNKPVYELLGGRCHEQLRAYANGWYRGDRTPKAFGEAARKVVQRGYTALKFDPFGSNWRTMTPAEEDLSLEIVIAVREAVGWNADILIEGHNRFTVAAAVRFGERMAKYQPAWFEEPVPHQNIGAMAEVARHLNIPVACGESYSSKQQFAELLKFEAVHIVQPEPLFLGGLLAAKQVSGMADAHYAVTAPHSAQGPVCSMACAHLNAATPNFYIHETFDEFNYEEVPWESRIVSGAVEIEDGFVQIPERPGLGIDLNLEEIARHPYQAQNYLPLFKPGWERRSGS
ncbi:MAG: mandelate racemase/muconate lactonizing enzyme family protein [Armatimonadetes bacterium]|nr:mandelate racemase/muconate lactonizing enzyme family protein [Armatimonadota bacterium]